MPPWNAAHGFGPKYANDASLKPEEIATIAAWTESEAPKGNKGELPRPRVFSCDWMLGTPDLIVEMEEDFEIPALGDDVYRCFVLPTNLTKDVYVSAVEYRPSRNHRTKLCTLAGACEKSERSNESGRVPRREMKRGGLLECSAER